MSGCDSFDFEAPQDEFTFMEGLRSADGTTFYPHVSAEGVLSWTNDGGKPNPDPVNIKGADGKSAYAAAVEAGFTGTEAEFSTYLSGIGDLTQEVADQKSAIDAKQDAPSTAGTAGQVLGLDDDLNPVWLDQTGGGGSGGTNNYNNLTNKPRINGVLLSGDKSAADLGLAAASDIPTVPVQSVNGETGAVVLDASDVGAVAEPQTAGTAGQVLGLDSNLNPVWVNQSGGGGTANYNDLSNKPQIEGVTLSGNKTAADFGLAKASDIPAVPVQSVNGKTGAVVLDASDVGALPDSTAIPSKTSDLTNDSGFVNASGAAAAAPVQSVNGITGAVNVQPTITASGILKGNGSAVSAATKGTDYGALAFTVTLTAAGWSSNAQTVSNANFVASGYGYIVSPASGSFADYASAQIYADDVTVTGQMTFHCASTPSSDLTVNILRVVSA